MPTLTAAALPRSGTGRTAGGDRSYRPDIQGLRAVAVVLVVLYHCGVPGIRGGYVGVDVFFVISGFLITRHLLGEHRRTGRMSLRTFYARRIRRLLPSALAVVVVTMLVFRWWGPPLQAVPVAHDGLFSTFYAMNVHLATLGVDYQHADGPVSPLQHYWSLAVEEQFYILWPVLIILVMHLTGRFRAAGMTVLTGAVVAGSLLTSALLTPRNAPLAYFTLQSRAWELGVGALIAVGAPALVRWLVRWSVDQPVNRPVQQPVRRPGNRFVKRLGTLVPAAMGWSGLLLIVGSGVLFTAATPFPGTAAAIPVAGAALVLISGLAGRSGGESLLASPVPLLLGRLSYGWYLWHWPVLVLAPAVLGRSLGWPGNCAAVLVGLGLAVVTNLLIEEPAGRTRWSSRRWFAIGGSLSAVVTVAAVGIVLLPPGGLSDTGPAQALNLSSTTSAQLARLLTDAYLSPAVPSNVTPSLQAAADDVPPTTADGCNAPFLAITVPPCVFGDPTGARTVVLFGDSHAEQWFGALESLSIARGWRLISWTKAACPLADVLLFSEQLHRPFTECPTWRSLTLNRIAALHPDVVIASGSDTLAAPGYANSLWSANTATTLSALTAAAGRVVYLADVPAPGTNVPLCLAGNFRAPRKCEFSGPSQQVPGGAGGAPSGRRAGVRAAAERLGVPVIDPTPWLCAPAGCPVVLQNVLLYRDTTHLTQSASRALAPLLARALAASVSWMA